MTDSGVYKLAKQLVDRLAIELEATRAGAVCNAMVHPGDMTPAYGCGCDAGEGMAWTRVVSIMPSKDFPAPYLGLIKPSTIVQSAVTIELGVDRCYWTPADNGMPDVPTLDSMARDAMDDAAAMRRTIWCALDGNPVVPGMWVPRGPGGGIHGGTMMVTVLADVWCGCDAPIVALDDVVPMLEGDPRT